MAVTTIRTGTQIRQEFIDFFRERGHSFVPSSPVVLADDPTLLFANAGMNQFKDVFLGTGSRPYTRAVNSQKCIRVSGKHNDLEEVGHDTYHHTFFEMLGNWSFGDYFKREAIEWAWELLTGVWGLPKERLYATVFEGDKAQGIEADDEAADLWRTATDIGADHILRFDKKDNFWEMGETGPCGPCSEIHIDMTADASGGDLVNAGDPRVMELWNLVFIQFNRSSGGSLEALPAKHVDTGMGFERIVAMLQQTDNYGTDVFGPLLDRIGEVAGVTYSGGSDDQRIAFRVLADHIRMLSFSIADGVLPSNEGRGYVLRRLLRRAARYGRTLELTDPFIHELAGTVATMYSGAFPEVAARADYVAEVIKSEEASFNKTLGRGLEIFADIVADTEQGSGKRIPGEEAFRLYDTYGFPLDLTRVMAEERGLAVDEAGFEEAMAAQRERARRGGKFTAGGFEAGDWVELSPLAEQQQFVGYEQLEVATTIHRYALQDGTYHVVLAQTPFYAESGGQVGDTGVIEGEGLSLIVDDTQRDGDFSICLCRSENGAKLAAGPVTARVDSRRRLPTTANHTATHLLHAALREVLGNHVHQAGSLVAPDHLRFDFTHFKRIERADLQRIERIVNQAVQQDHPVDWFTSGFEEAKKQGAMALFGEKYGDVVRVVAVGEGEPWVSMELCGGCHVRHTGQIGPFLITSEASIASGVRRIEARSGPGAVRLMQAQRDTVQELGQLLGSKPDALVTRTQEVLDQVKALEKQLKKIESERVLDQSTALEDSAEQVGDVRLIAQQLDGVETGVLKTMADRLRGSGPRTVAFLVAAGGRGLGMACGVSDDLAGELSAADLVKQAAAVAGGGGGGRPTLATAGAKQADQIGAVLAAARAHVTEAAGG